MAGQREAPIEVYTQTPLFLFLRNVSCPALAQLVVREFPNTVFIRSMMEEERTQATTHTPSPHGSVLEKNLFEFLSMVDKKGKRKEEKLRKEENKNQVCGQDEGEDEERISTSRVLHIKNLKYNKEALEKVKVIQLMNESREGLKEEISLLQTLDVGFLLHILSNDIIKFNLSERVQQAIARIKAQRNKLLHPNRSSMSNVAAFLEELCNPTKTLYDFLGHQPQFVDDLKNLCLREAKASPNLLSQEILSQLKRESYIGYNRPLHSVYPGVKYSGRGDNDGENDSLDEKVLDNLEEFVCGRCEKNALGENPYPLMLHGSSGMGKSSLVAKLTADLASNPRGPLVVRLDPTYQTLKPKRFWQQIGQDLAAPGTLERYGADTVVQVLRINIDHILFIADWNIRQLSEVQCGVSQGTWLITHCGTPELPLRPNTLTVLPLTPPQVEQMLESLSISSERCERALSNYQECKYKGVLISPDIVNVFSEQDCCVPFYQLLNCYVTKRVPSTVHSQHELVKLGKVAFEMIRSTCGKCYSEEKLKGVQNDVWKPLLMQEEGGREAEYTFRYRVVEDYLVALYVISNPAQACTQWLKQIPLFKRVFRFVSSFWCEHPARIQEVLPYMKKYLCHLMDITFKANTNSDAMEVDMAEDEVTGDSAKGAKSRAKNNFTKWSFLVTLVEDCEYQSDILQLLAELLACKTRWQFKCRMLSDDVVRKLPRVLREVVLKQPLTIKLESGCNTDIIKQLWEILSTLTNLHAFASVQIYINHAVSRHIPCKMKLMSLARSLAATFRRDSHLSVTKYVGPLACTDIPRFLRCPSLQGVEELAVIVYDRATLAEVLACQGLAKLRYIDVSVVLKRSGEQIDSERPKLELPHSDPPIPLYLKVRYFPGLQNLLSDLKGPEHLEYLSICHIYIHRDFKLDLSAFTGLSCLFLQFKPGSLEPIPSFPVYSPSNSLIGDPMDVDEGKEESQQEGEESQCMDHDLDVSSMQLPRRDWALDLTLKLVIPEGLPRLMLRDAEFCDDTNHFLLSRYFQKYRVQRLLLLDTDLSVVGATDLLRGITRPPNIQDMSPEFKRKCTLSNTSATSLGYLCKQPRLSPEERKEKKKAEKDRKQSGELVISSKNTTCYLCQLSPCNCLNLSPSDYWAKLEDVVVLTHMTYQYSGHSFSFTNNSWVTIHFNVCKDLRIQCKVTRLDDHTLATSKEYEWLSQFLDKLLVAQFITLTDTQLTHQGSMSLAKRIWAGKQAQRTPDPFSLTVVSARHPSANEATRHSELVSFLEQDDTLVQFQFKCCCQDCQSSSDRSSQMSQYHIKKTYHGDIYLNGCKILSRRPHSHR